MKKLALIFTVLLGIMVGSCKKEPNNNPKLENGFRLSYSVLTSEAASPTTRTTVDATTEENKINTLHILFFESSTTSSGKFLEAYDGSPSAGSTLSPNGVIDVDFQGSSLDKTTPYNMLFVANIKNFLGNMTVEDWLTTLGGKSEIQVIHEYRATTSTATNVNSGDIFMSATAVKAVGKDEVKVQLVRGVARIDVYNNTELAKYSLTSVSVWNVYPSTFVWDNSSPKSYTESRIKRFKGVDNVVDNRVVGQLYAFENNVASPKQDDYLTTCLIIGMKTNGVLSYYRVNVNLNQVGQALVRNNAYKISIQAVRGPGAANENEAYESGELLLDVSLNGWNESQEGNVKYDGDNLFAVPTTKIIFTPSGETRHFSIFTSGTGQLRMSQKVLPTGFSAELDVAQKQLVVSATSSKDKREGWIELSFAGMRTIIYITQTGAHDEYLDLSQYNIPSFPSSGTVMSPNPITVSSSGSWTATIYDDVFSFSTTVDDKVKTGKAGDDFSVFSVKDNSGTTLRHSFILVSLDSNHDINRVIVLSQKATGSITLSPDISQIRFNAQGQEIDSEGGAKASTAIYPYAGDGAVSWTASLSGSSASLFTLSSLTGTTSISGTLGTPVHVTTKRNIEKNAITASMRIRLTATATMFKDVAISQEAHKISLQYAIIPTIGIDGGETPPITVTSSDKWVATLVVENGSARLSQTTGVSGDSFKVIFDANHTPGKTPKATLVVTVEGTAVASQTITINQTALMPRPLIIQTREDTYGSMTVVTGAWFDSWNSAIRNKSYFVNKLDAKVYTAGDFTFNTAITPANSTCIYNMNQGLGTAYEAALKTWLNRDTRNFLVVIDDIYNAYSSSMLETIDSRFQCEYDNANTPTTRPREVVALPVGVSQKKVWDYIMVNGPFGKVDTSIEFFGDGVTGCLSNYPPSTVPILINKNGGRIHLAIDPVYRILYISDCDMFSTLGNRNSYPEGSEKWKFLNNVIAFMVNSAQYGDYFLDKFRP